jgi:hypothetical protein
MSAGDTVWWVSPVVGPAGVQMRVRRGHVTGSDEDVLFVRPADSDSMVWVHIDSLLVGMEEASQ